jgi:hypothetical protein
LALQFVGADSNQQSDSNLGVEKGGYDTCKALRVKGELINIPTNISLKGGPV